MIPDGDYEKELAAFTEEERERTVVLIPNEAARVDYLKKFFCLTFNPADSKHFIVFISVLKALISMIHAEDKHMGLRLMGDFMKLDGTLITINNSIIAPLITDTIERSVKQRLVAIAA